MEFLPSWVWLTMGGIILAVGGTLLDKYLLTKYFACEEDNDSGPGALLIYSAYFSIFVLIGILIFGNSEITFNPVAILLALFAGVLNGLWILLYLYAINRTDVSKAVPIFQTIPAFGLIIAYFTLGEVISSTQLLAMALMVFGALILMHTKMSNFLRLDTKTLLLMFSSAFLVASSQTVFKLTTIFSNYMTGTFWLWFGFLLFGMILHISIKSYQMQFNHMFRDRLRSVIALNSFNELFDNIGELFIFAAIMIGPIALVQSLNTYEPILIFLAGVVLTRFSLSNFKEDISRLALVQKSVGISVVLLGSLILYSTI